MREERATKKKKQKRKWEDEKTRAENAARKSIMKPPEVIHLTSFRIEQRQQAAPRGKIFAVPYLPALW